MLRIRVFFNDICIVKKFYSIWRFVTSHAENKKTNAGGTGLFLSGYLKTVNISALHSVHSIGAVNSTVTF